MPDLEPLEEASPPTRTKGTGKRQGKQRRPAETRPRTPVGMRGEGAREEGKGKGQRQPQGEGRRQRRGG